MRDVICKELVGKGSRVTSSTTFPVLKVAMSQSKPSSGTRGSSALKKSSPSPPPPLPARTTTGPLLPRPPKPGQTRGGSLEEGVLSVLECPVCFEYMTPPIIMCENGHNICDPCKAKCHSVCPTCRRALLQTRNIALEQLAQTTAYPCRHADSGCPLVGPAAHVRLHEPVCVHQVFLCPLRCSWRGRRDQLRSHCLGSHLQNTSVFDKGGATVVAWEVSQAGCFRDYKHALFAFGEAFLYVKRFHMDSRKLAFAVQHVGYSSDAPKFRYKFKMLKEQTKQTLSFGRPVHGHADDVESLMQTNDCITVDFDTVVSYAKGVRTFKIIKVNQQEKA